MKDALKSSKVTKFMTLQNILFLINVVLLN